MAITSFFLKKWDHNIENKDMLTACECACLLHVLIDLQKKCSTYFLIT